jgi:hypothetical protein
MTPAKMTMGRPPAIPKRATTRPKRTAGRQLRSPHRQRPAGLRDGSSRPNTGLGSATRIREREVLPAPYPEAFRG